MKLLTTMAALTFGFVLPISANAQDAPSAKEEASPPMKEYKIDADEIEKLAPGYGAAFVTDRITVEGFPVRFMYRAPPDHPSDSGWRFMSGTEDDAYMDNADNHSLMDVNTIANFDPSIVPFLDAPVGSTFEKLPGAPGFVEVRDWDAPE